MAVADEPEMRVACAQAMPGNGPDVYFSELGHELVRQPLGRFA